MALSLILGEAKLTAERMETTAEVTLDKVADGFAITAPCSLLRFGANLPPLKILPVELPIPPLPVGIMTVKNRTVSPVAKLFIDRARELTKPLAKR